MEWQKKENRIFNLENSVFFFTVLMVRAWRIFGYISWLSCKELALVK